MQIQKYPELSLLSPSSIPKWTLGSNDRAQAVPRDRCDLVLQSGTDLDAQKTDLKPPRSSLVLNQNLRATRATYLLQGDDEE